MRFIKHAVAGAAALAMAACSNDVEPLTATPVHGVVLTVTVPGRCLVGHRRGVGDIGGVRRAIRVAGIA
jgi:hypothetical protein